MTSPVGVARPRPDAPPKVRGATRYAADRPRRGLLHARPVLSVGYAWALLASGELEAVHARLRDAGDVRSRYSRRVRIRRGGVYRVRAPADTDHATGLSRGRRISVQ